MKTMKVLHVASFNGNVGDNANHNGTHLMFNENINADLSFEQLEIRKSYQNYTLSDKWAFDDDFANKVNSNDLTIIGGGNYFELWLDKSSTGTTIDISIPVLEKIKKPVIFYGLGCDIGMGASKENTEKFRIFLQYLETREIFSVFLRNDGSKRNFKSLFPNNEFEQLVSFVPDGGFFVKPNNNVDESLVVKGKKNVVINISGDMLDLRFPGGAGMKYDQFINEMSTTIEALIEQDNANIIFAPHMHKDLITILDCMKCINDFKVRNNIRVAPLLTGQGTEKIIFALYDQADLVLGMRFHANVCPIGLMTPTIGLSSYIQIDGLYSELEMKDSCIVVNKGSFKKELISLAKKYLNEPEEINQTLKIKQKYLKNWITEEHKKIGKIINKI